MPARRKVSIRQMELLLEFAESHGNIALGRFPGGSQAVRKTREAWDSVAQNLNAVATGVTKTPDQWRRYWIEYKAKTKAKAADSRRNAVGTGGGPNKLVPLTQIEKRVLAVIGPVAVAGLPGVSLPINAEVNSIAEPPMQEVWLEDSSPDVQIYLPTTQSGIISPASSQTVEPYVILREQSRNRRLSTAAAARRQRSTRNTCRNERVPNWTYNMEMRRIAAEERHAAAMEEMVKLMAKIQEDVHKFVHRMEK